MSIKSDRELFLLAQSLIKSVEECDLRAARKSQAVLTKANSLGQVPSFVADVLSSVVPWWDEQMIDKRESGPIPFSSAAEAPALVNALQESMDKEDIGAIDLIVDRLREMESLCQLPLYEIRMATRLLPGWNSPEWDGVGRLVEQAEGSSSRRPRHSALVD